MPKIRQYPQANAQAPTDAFVIDRQGVGTMYIQASAVSGGGPLTIAVEENGTLYVPAATTLNFTGGATVTQAGAVANIDIPVQNAGTVTTVNVSGGSSGLSFTGGPINSGGTITLTGGQLAKAFGGTGTNNPSLIAGQYIQITGSWPNQTITALGAVGTVVSIDASGGTTGLSFTGGPVTSAGVLTLGGTLNVANGGTGTGTATGTGNLVLSNSPTLTTPAIGGGGMTLAGSTSGTLTLKANPTTTSYTLSFPPTGGTLNYLLQTDGSGTTNWVNPSALGLGTVTSVGLSTGTTGLTVGGNTSQTINANGTFNLAGTLAVANGGTGTTVSTGANSVVLRDSNQNVTANAYFAGFQTIAAPGSLVTLTAASPPVTVVTGSGGQTIQLPDATTLANGATFSFNNNQSSGVITVRNNSGTTIVSVQSGSYVTVTLLSNGTTAGSWDWHNQAPSNVSWSTNTLNFGGGGSAIVNATWNGSVVGPAYGGTGINNGTNTITLGGNISTASSLTTSGAFPLTLTTTGATNVTLPTSGTLLSTSNVVTSFQTSLSGLTPSTASTGAVTLQGALGTSSGGTGLSGATPFGATNNAIYSSSASALTAGTLPVAAGGTGAITAALALTNLSAANNTLSNANVTIPVTGAVQRSALSKLGDTISATDIGMKCDAITIFDISTTAGSNLITSPQAPFVSTDNGKVATIVRGGAIIAPMSVGRGITGYIKYISATQVRLFTDATLLTAKNITQTLSGEEMIYGTDDSVALNAAIQNFAIGYSKTILFIGHSMLANTVLMNQDHIRIIGNFSKFSRSNIQWGNGTNSSPGPSLSALPSRFIWAGAQDTPMFLYRDRTATVSMGQGLWNVALDCAAATCTAIGIRGAVATSNRHVMWTRYVRAVNTTYTSPYQYDGGLDWGITTNANLSPAHSPAGTWDSGSHEFFECWGINRGGQIYGGKFAWIWGDLSYGNPNESNFVDCGWATDDGLVSQFEIEQSDSIHFTNMMGNGYCTLHANDTGLRSTFQGNIYTGASCSHGHHFHGYNVLLWLKGSVGHPGDTQYGAQDHIFTGFSRENTFQNLKIEAGASISVLTAGTALRINYPGASSIGGTGGLMYGVVQAGCQLVSVANQTISNSSFTALSFATSGPPSPSLTYDELGVFNSATPTRLIVPPNIHKVQLDAYVLWDANPYGVRILRIYKNGSPMPFLDERQSIIGGDNTANQIRTPGPINCVPGDYFEAYVWQNSGGNLNALNNYVWFTATFY
jgi:hypothetical protein